MSELNSLTLGRSARRAEEENASRPSNWPTRIWRRSRRRARSTPMCWRRRSAPPPWRRPSDARIAAGKAGPLEGIPLAIKDMFCTEGVRIDGVLAHPRQFRADLRLDGHRQSVARRRGAARQDQQRRVRHGLVERDLAFRPGDLAVAAQGLEHAADAGRLVRRLGRGGGGAICASAPPAPTPAARSASRRPSPAPSASSRPMAAARAGASSPSRRRSTRPGRSRARCATPRSCCARWPGPMPRTRPAPILPVPDYEAAVGKSIKGLRIGIPKEYRLDGMPAEIEKMWEQGTALAEGGGRRAGRGVAAAHQIRAARLLHRRPGGGLVQSRAL